MKISIDFTGFLYPLPRFSIILQRIYVKRSQYSAVSVTSYFEWYFFWVPHVGRRAGLKSVGVGEVVEGEAMYLITAKWKIRRWFSLSTVESQNGKQKRLMFSQADCFRDYRL